MFRELHELGFSIISQPRTGRGGGVAFIFKLGLPTKRNRVQKFKSFEVCEAILNSNCDSVRFCLIYRPGVSSKNIAKYEDSKVTAFLNEFESYLNNVMTKHGRPILCGDFNFHLENKSDVRSQ